MTSLTFHVMFYEQIPMKLFQVEHAQISLLTGGGNFTLLHLNNAEFLLKASHYGGKLKKAYNKNNKKQEYAKQKHWQVYAH